MWQAWEWVEVFAEFWLGGPKGRDHREGLGVRGRITLSWTLGKWVSMGRTGFGWHRIWSMACFRDHSNEPSGSTKKAGYCLKS
jgi:hypothetical protein